MSLALVIFVTKILRLHVSEGFMRGPRGETSLARQHSEKVRIICAIVCAVVLLMLSLWNSSPHMHVVDLSVIGV